MDYLITNGSLVTEHAVFPADLAVSGGKIAALAAPGALRAPTQATLDAAGMLVLPGAVDVHFHCRTPGYDERGDFGSETRAAAAGGVTTVFEMPISRPGCATPAIFEHRRRLLEDQALIDVALYGAPGTLIPADVQGMAEAGAIAFKIFMHRAPLGREDEFIGICLTDDDQLYEALRLTKASGRRLVVHCESDALLEQGIGRLRQHGRVDPAAHGESRPPVVEAVAVARILTLAEDLGAPVHIAHVTCAAALNVIRRFRRDGLDITAETCPQYLFFTEQDYLRLGAFAKINPPIRGATDQAALWQGLADGSLDLVTTDHSTFLLEEKARGAADIWRAPSGAPGVQTLLPIMLTAALQGRLSLPDVVRLTSASPARIFGLAGRKGTLATGADADIVVYDPRPTVLFSRERMLSQAADVDKLYEGMLFQGQVVATFSRGRLVYHQGTVLAERGSGSFLRPA
jgi:allantoinase